MASPNIFHTITIHLVDFQGLGIWLAISFHPTPKLFELVWISQ